MSKNKKIALAAIFKNEKEYVLEWLAFHRLIGFENFYIADNCSNDGTSQLLISLENAGYIKRLYFPTHEKHTQLRAYEYILSKYGSEMSFVGFIDADEFIVPESTEFDIISRLNELYEDDNISAVGLNWSVYGSSGKVKRENKLVIERFFNHACQNTGVNRHIKSFVKPERFNGFFHLTL